MCSLPSRGLAPRLVAALVLFATFTALPTQPHAQEPASSNEDEDAAAADDVVRAMPPGEDRELDAPEAVSEYQDKRIEIVADGGHPAAHLGLDTSTLTGASLYLALDRPDLARSYRIRKTARYTLLIGSSASFALGLYLAFTAQQASCAGVTTPAEHSQCERDAESDADAQKKYGAIAAILGAVVFGATWTMLDSDPLTLRQVEREAWKRNRKLRRDLGVIDVSVLPDKRPGALTLAPSIAAGGLGVQLVGAF